MRILGVPGFAPTGSASYLLDHFGLTADGIAAAPGHRAAPDHILAIDQGTVATKALLVDADGAIVARGSAPVGADPPAPRLGRAGRRRDLGAASRPRSPTACTRRRRGVAAVGLSTQRESLLLWDRAHRRAAAAR